MNALLILARAHTRIVELLVPDAHLVERSIALHHQRITDAVREQLMTLDFALSFTRGHLQAFRVAQRIAALAPTGLDDIFSSNSGSEAVETAIKMRLAYSSRARRGGAHDLRLARACLSAR